MDHQQQQLVVAGENKRMPEEAGLGNARLDGEICSTDCLCEYVLLLLLLLLVLLCCVGVRLLAEGAMIGLI